MQHIIWPYLKIRVPKPRPLGYLLNLKPPVGVFASHALEVGEGGGGTAICQTTGPILDRETVFDSIGYIVYTAKYIDIYCEIVSGNPL